MKPNFRWKDEAGSASCTDWGPTHNGKLSEDSKQLCYYKRKTRTGRRYVSEFVPLQCKYSGSQDMERTQSCPCSSKLVKERTIDEVRWWWCKWKIEWKTDSLRCLLVIIALCMLSHTTRAALDTASDNTLDGGNPKVFIGRRFSSLTEASPLYASVEEDAGVQEEGTSGTHRPGEVPTNPPCTGTEQDHIKVQYSSSIVENG